MLNTKSFTPEEVKEGLLQDLLTYLLEYNANSKNSYYDIHITTDGYCTIVEWTDIDYEMNEGERFAFVDSEHEILKCVTFPDNHSEYLLDDEAQAAIDNWLAENPGWEKNAWGRWVNVEENKRLQQELIGDTDGDSEVIKDSNCINDCDQCDDTTCEVCKHVHDQDDDNED